MVGDGGLTPIEIIIGVVLLAVLSGVVVFQAFRFIAKADDSAASRSLEAAVAVVEIMGQLGSSGGGNLVGDPKPSTEIAITKLNEQLSGAKLTTLEQFGVSLQGRSTNDRNFADVPGDAQSVWVNVPKSSTIPRERLKRSDIGRGLNLAEHKNPNLGDPSNSYSVGKRFIEAEYPEFPNGYVYGFRVQPGNLVRVGVKSVSGATFCAISVRDGAVIAANSKEDVSGYETTDKSKLVAINGTGYQSVNAEASSEMKLRMNNNAYRPGADCGAFWLKTPNDNKPYDLGPDNDHTQQYFVAELPGLPGTDTRLMPPGPISYAYS